MRAVSEVFNPFFSTFYLLLVVFLFIPDAVQAISALQRRQFFLIVFLSCFVFPLLIFAISRRMGIIAPNCLHSRKGRVPIMLLAVLSYFLGTFLVYTFFSNANFSFPISFFIASSLVVFTIFLCNFFWKISVHASSIAALFGFFLALSRRYPSNQLSVILLVCATCLGLVIASRYYLGRHSFFELLSGSILGFFIAYSVFFISYGRC